MESRSKKPSLVPVSWCSERHFPNESPWKKNPRYLSIEPLPAVFEVPGKLGQKINHPKKGRHEKNLGQGP